MQTSNAGGERHTQRLTKTAFQVPPAYLQPIRSLLAVHCRNYRGEGVTIRAETRQTMLKNNLKYQKIQKCSEGNHMKIAVIYFSRGGNTRKIAEAMAEELGVIAVDVKKEQPDVSDADLLVVGSGT
jgi:flavorubredoxin